MSRTNFDRPKDVRVIQIRLCTSVDPAEKHRIDIAFTVCHLGFEVCTTSDKL